MCQAKPGPRCWSDSKKKDASLTGRLTTAEKALTTNRTKAREAAQGGDLTAFARLRKEEEKLVVKVNNLRTEVRHNQRDMDGTKTGLRKIDEQIALCENEKERTELLQRKQHAEAARFARSHALETIQSNRKPLLRIAA
jgi:hypothetical protein